MERDIKVSAIIPVYNAEKYLRKCLDSVINQTLQEIEIICVDDGSTDNSLSILREYEGRDSRIKILTQKNQHAGVARNNGLKHANGDYVHFLDADDWLEKNAYEVLYNVIQMSKSDVCMFSLNTFDDKTGETFRVSHAFRGKPFYVTSFHREERFFIYNGVAPWNKLYSRSFIENNGISFDSLICANDRSFYYQTILRAESITIISDYLINYRVNNASSLVNDAALKNFDCKFKSYEAVWDMMSDESDSAKRMLLDVTMVDFFNSYKKASGETKRTIAEQIASYIPRMPLFLLKENLNSYSWYQQYYEVLSSSFDNNLRSLVNKKDTIIVSLTSYPPRIKSVYKTIETLINQSLKADKIILWLAEEEFPNKENELPDELLEQKNRGLEIGWYQNIRSYKKLIPAIKEYPEAIIVTADDDIYYQRDWLTTLYHSYLNNPYCIHAHCITKFFLNEKNEFATIAGGREYWPFPTYLNKLVGVGGVLYPPHCLHSDVLDEAKFMALAPTSDDIWFWLMGALAGYRVNVVPNNITKLDYVEGTQECALWRINDHGENLFWVHFKNILSAYPQIEELLRISYVIANESAKLYPFVDNSALIDAETCVERAEKELLNIRGSVSYRIGRIITWVPRKARGFSRCYREHGWNYTCYRVLEHLQMTKCIRLVRGFIRCFNEHGARYTWHRVLVKLHLQNGKTEQRAVAKQLVSATNAMEEKPQVKKDYEYYKNLPSERYAEELCEWFKRVTRDTLDLDNPKTFNEKIQWMKLYDSTPLKTQLADKYLVREWVKEKIGEEYLIPLLGVWDTFDEIDFDQLPDSFVLKANHGCGWNIIVKDKSIFDVEEAKRRFDLWMSTNFAFRAGFELHYMNIKPRIIAEEYLENGNNDLYDYKVFCFGGVAYSVMFLSERKTGLKMAFYDREWNKLPFVYSHPKNEDVVPKPQKIEQMIELAEKLSKGFAHVRVDFYVLNDGSIKFGEMTFTSASGNCKWDPPEQNLIYGNLINLPEKSPIPEKLF